LSDSQAITAEAHAIVGNNQNFHLIYYFIPRALDNSLNPISLGYQCLPTFHYTHILFFHFPTIAGSRE
jgi:hypothetical protein